MTLQQAIALYDIPVASVVILVIFVLIAVGSLLSILALAVLPGSRPDKDKYSHKRFMKEKD
jgi:hypothetical protein